MTKQEFIAAFIKKYHNLVSTAAYIGVDPDYDKAFGQYEAPDQDDFLPQLFGAYYPDLFPADPLERAFVDLSQELTNAIDHESYTSIPRQTALQIVSAMRIPSVSSITIGLDIHSYYATFIDAWNAQHDEVDHISVGDI